MAAGSKLQLKFVTSSGDKTWTFANADPNVPISKVKTLVIAMINNGSIYHHVPLAAKSAKVITTTETEFVLE